MLIYTTFAIECAHRMTPELGVEGIHGHSYWLQVYVESSAAKPYPLPRLQVDARKIHRLLDHKLLNDILPAGIEPSMEAIVDFVRANWEGTALQKIIVRRDTLNTGVEWVA